MRAWSPSGLVALALCAGCATEASTDPPPAPPDAAVDAPAPDVVAAHDVPATPDVATAPDVVARPDVVTAPDVVTGPDAVAVIDVPPPRDVAFDAPTDVFNDVPAPRDAGADVAADVPTDTDPPLPTFPSRIGHLTFAIRTGSGANDGTNTNTLSVCLTETRCFPLNVLDVNDFRRGEVDVYHFEGVDLPRASVDRVEIRSANGDDAWRPTCVAMQWDGEPVHCADNLTNAFGNGAGELARWRDPAGVHRGCVSCYPNTATHGPVVGAVTPDAAQLMVRTDATRRVVVRVTDDARPADPPRRFVLDPSPEDDFTARFALSGLSPSRAYTAALEVDGRPAATPARFRTPPADGAAGTLRVALGSCTSGVTQPIFDVVAAQRPDLFVWVGDNHYGNTGDLQSLWWNYRRMLEVGPRAALLRAVPGLAVWDDHDYVGNNTDRTSPGRESALRAFADYQPNGSYGLRSDPGVYFSSRWGDVELFMLDVRYTRDPPGATGARIMSDAQQSWLEAALRRSTATFKLIASGTNFSAGGGESWAQYPSSRNRLFDFIAANRIEGVVLLSGDIHRSHLRRIRRMAGYELPEVVSSPLANTTSTCPSTYSEGTQVACYNGGPSFAVLEFDTRGADPVMVARIVDAAGGERGRMEVRRSALR